MTPRLCEIATTLIQIAGMLNDVKDELNDGKVHKVGYKSVEVAEFTLMRIASELDSIAEKE